MKKAAMIVAISSFLLSMPVAYADECAPGNGKIISKGFKPLDPDAQVLPGEYRVDHIMELHAKLSMPLTVLLSDYDLRESLLKLRPTGEAFQVELRVVDLSRKDNGTQCLTFGAWQRTGGDAQGIERVSAEDSDDPVVCIGSDGEAKASLTVGQTLEDTRVARRLPTNLGITLDTRKGAVSNFVTLFKADTSGCKG